jgi:hypothetical protein
MGIHVHEQVSVVGYCDQTEPTPAPSSLPSVSPTRPWAGSPETSSPGQHLPILETALQPGTKLPALNLKGHRAGLVLVVLPAATWTVTTGWVAGAVPLVAVGLGAVVKVSLAADAA